jgi:hypothetical protein
MMYITTPSSAKKLISALGTEYFWIDDISITGVAAERAKVPQIDLTSHFTFKKEDLRCCLNGGGCEFLVSLSPDDWVILEQYLRLTFTTAVNRKGRGNCKTGL